MNTALIDPENNKSVKGLFSIDAIAPYLIVFLWLLIIGYLIWDRAERSAYPPVFDQLSYAMKAKNFWDNVANLKPVNPLNIGYMNCLIAAMFFSLRSLILLLGKEFLTNIDTPHSIKKIMHFIHGSAK